MNISCMPSGGVDVEIEGVHYIVIHRGPATYVLVLCPRPYLHARVCILGCGARDYICARLAGLPRPPRSPSRGGDLELGSRFNVSL